MNGQETLAYQGKFKYFYLYPYVPLLLGVSPLIELISLDLAPSG